MSHLARVMESPYGEDLLEVLAMMRATLKNPPEATPALHDAWCMALMARRFPPDLLVPTCEFYVCDGSWFLTPGEFMRKGREIQEARKMRAVLDATEAELREQNEAYREALREKGIDPDALVGEGAVKALAARLSVVPGEMPKEARIQRFDTSPVEYADEPTPEQRAAKIEEAGA